MTRSMSSHADRCSGTVRLLRTSLPFLVALFTAGTKTAAAQSVRALTTSEQERTERLLENRIACRGCHIIAGEGGAIGPMLDGISQRAELDHVRSIIADPGVIPGSIMPHQPLSSGDLDRLTRYVMTRPVPRSSLAIPAQAPPVIAPGQENNGPALYARHCAACHGDTGEADGWNAPNLPVRPTRHADPALMARRSDDTLYDAIAAGGYVLDRSARMPGFGNLLSNTQIRALVTHIRTLCTCTQPTWAGGS